MRVLILGIDGYIGWPLALHLKSKGHEIIGIDNGCRRIRVRDLGSESLTPIMSYPDRKEYLGYDNLVNLDLGCGEDYLPILLNTFYPDAIVHLAEQPSAA